MASSGFARIARHVPKSALVVAAPVLPFLLFAHVARGSAQLATPASYLVVTYLAAFIVWAGLHISATALRALMVRLAPRSRGHTRTMLRTLASPARQMVVYSAIIGIVSDVTIFKARASRAAYEILGLNLSGAFLALFSTVLGTIAAARFASALSDANAPAPAPGCLTFRAPTRFARVVMPLVLAVGALLFVPADSMDPTLAASLYVALFALLAFGSSQSPLAVVGADGVYIRTEHGRFVPFTGEETVSLHEWGLEIVRAEATVARLHLRQRDRGRSGELAARVTSLIASARPSSDVLSATDALAIRADATVATTAYRAPSVPREDLWRVVESPITPVKLRVQAARELAKGRETFDANDDERLHAIAESCAEPNVRATLAEMAAAT